MNTQNVTIDSNTLEQVIVGLTRIQTYAQEPFKSPYEDEQNLFLSMNMGSIEHRAELLIVILKHAMKYPSQ